MTVSPQGCHPELVEGSLSFNHSGTENAENGIGFLTADARSRTLRVLLRGTSLIEIRNSGFITTG
jgi:hypothetical protein